MTQEVSELLKKVLALPQEARAAFGRIASGKPGRHRRCFGRRGMEPRDCTTHPGTGFRQGKTYSMGRGAASDHRPPQWLVTEWLSPWTFIRPRWRNLKLQPVVPGTERNYRK